MNRKSTSAKPRSAMFRSLVIFACLGHVLGQEQDPSCWLQSRQEATGAGLIGRPGAALDLLGSKSTSMQARIKELRARMKEEEEKIQAERAKIQAERDKFKAMRAELNKIRNAACPSGGEYLTFEGRIGFGDYYNMSNGDQGFLSRVLTAASTSNDPCGGVGIRNGAVVFVEDESSPSSPICALDPYQEIVLQAVFSLGPPSLIAPIFRNVSTMNVTFQGNAAAGTLQADVFVGEFGATDLPTGHTFVEGDNIIDVSSLWPSIAGFQFQARGSPTAEISTLRFNGYTLCGSQATVVGDPHIKTLDGRHFTLLSQGTFSLWRYSGVSTDVIHKLPASPSSIDVDWQVYAHYSGHQSYTKALLLLDKSGGSARQSLEITSKDCEWRAKDPNGRWSTGNAELTASEQDPFATGLQLHTAHNRTRVSFVMIKQGVRKEVATLSVSCRKGRNINMAIDMKHSADLRFVDGELRVARTGAPVSTLQRESQSDESDEFEVKTPWKDLGGSESASLYLQEMEGTGRGLNLLQTCEDAQMVHAFELCSKHLGADMQQADGPDGDFFNDCVFDVCRGGEVAAELAAELIAVRRST